MIPMLHIDVIKRGMRVWLQTLCMHNNVPGSR